MGEGRARAVPKRDKKAIALILQKKLVKERGGKMGGDNARSERPNSFEGWEAQKVTDTDDI